MRISDEWKDGIIPPHEYVQGPLPINACWECSRPDTDDIHAAR